VSENNGGFNTSFTHANGENCSKILTIKQLKQFKGLEDISESAAEQIIDGLYKLSLITFKIINQNESDSI
jgi:hypothetical protein